MGMLDQMFGGNAPANPAYVINVPFVPQNVQQMMQMPHAMLGNEYEVAALCVAVLCNYCQDAQATVEMMNYLRGPRPLSNLDVQFLRDRLAGKPYKMLSYLNGTSPANNYTPATPLTVTVMANPYSYTQPEMATLWIPSSGTDSARQVVLRRKPSTAQWFIWDHIGLLPDIRVPISQDPWA